MKREDITSNLQELKSKGAFDFCNDGATVIRAELKHDDKTVNAFLHLNGDTITVSMGRFIKKKYKFAISEL